MTAPTGLLPSSNSLHAFTHSSAGLFIHNLFSSRKVPSAQEMNQTIVEYFNMALQTDDPDAYLNVLRMIRDVLAVPAYQSLLPKLQPLVVALDERMKNLIIATRMEDEEQEPSSLQTARVEQEREESPEPNDVIFLARIEVNGEMDLAVSIIGSDLDPELGAYMRRTLPA